MTWCTNLRRPAARQCPRLPGSSATACLHLMVASTAPSSPRSSSSGDSLRNIFKTQNLDYEARATNHEPRTTSHELRATNHEPRATNHEPRTTKQVLESIIFPLVRKRLREFTETSPQGVFSIAVIPLLFESHFDEDYDIIIAIASSEDLQIDRMMRTRGYSRAQAEARLAAQMPVAEKAARAHFVVVNDSTPEHLRKEAVRLVAWLQEKAQA